MMRNSFRNLLLLCLTILLFLLTFLLWWSSAAGQETPWQNFLHTIGQRNTGYEFRLNQAAAAEPICIAITVRNGLVGAAYNDLSVGALYETARPVLSEALTNAKKLVPIPEEELRDMLAEEVLFCEYYEDLPLSLLADWAGGKTDLSEYGTEIFVFRSGSLMIRQSSGALYRADSTVSEGVWKNAVDSLSDNGFSFAILKEGTDTLRPETLLPQSDAVQSDVLVMEEPTLFGDTLSADSLQTLLNAFSYSPFVQSYSENNGSTRVFVNNDSTLRITNDGEVQFVSTAATEKSDNTSFANQSDSARRLLEQAQRAVSDSTRAWLQSAYIDDVSGHTILIFRQSFSGIPILSDEPIGRFEFSEGVLISAELCLRRYLPSGQKRFLFPIRQMAAAVQEPNAWIGVAYLPDAEGNMIPQRCFRFQRNT